MNNTDNQEKTMLLAFCDDIKYFYTLQIRLWGDEYKEVHFIELSDIYHQEEYILSIILESFHLNFRECFYNHNE